MAIALAFDGQQHEAEARAKPGGKCDDVDGDPNGCAVDDPVVFGFHGFDLLRGLCEHPVCSSAHGNIYGGLPAIVPEQ